MARLNRYKLAHLHQLIVERKGNAATIARAVGCAPSTVTRHALMLGVRLPRVRQTLEQMQARQAAVASRYYRLKEAGTCVSCAKVPAIDGQVRCTDCAAYQRASLRNTRSGQ